MSAGARYMAPPKEPPPPVSELIAELIATYPFVFSLSVVISLMVITRAAACLWAHRRRRGPAADG